MAPRIESSDESEDDKPLGVATTNGASNGRALNGNGLGNANGKRPHALNSDAESKAQSPPSKRSKTATSKKPSSSSNSAPKANGNNANGISNGDIAARKRKASNASSSDDEPLSVPRQVASVAIPPPSNGEVVNADMPLAAAAASSAAAATSAPARRARAIKSLKEESGSDDDDDNVPLGQVAAKAKPTRKPAVKDEGDSSDDAPLVAKAKKPAAKTPKGKKASKVKNESGDDASPAPKKRATPAARKKRKVAAGSEEDEQDAKPADTKAEAKAKKVKAKKEEEEAEEIHRWWEEDALGDGSQKWRTLEHQGVLFPPAYEPLPRHVKMLYNGKPVDLPPDSEEVAGFFGAMLETDHAKDATFCKNFFNDWKTVLKKYPPRDGTKITDFDKCDFKPMLDYFEEEKARKKAIPAAEKKAAKAERDKVEAKYTFCLLDGRKEKVGNFRAEPPGLFRGRGDHPRKGAFKFRLYPKDITLNIGKDSPIPEPNIPGEWGKVQHDDTVTWLAHWKENINGNSKYVFLAAGSSLKGQSDMNKFEKARELKKHIEAVRRDYNVNLKSKVSADRQLATALYFIDKLALRAGNEKGEEEADTVGCCSLRYEHVTLQPPDKLVFDFLGKDSIRYYNVVTVEPQIYKNIRIFKGDPKGEGDAIFDRVTTMSINKFLTSYMKGLTAKVFRTYNASITFQQQLDERTPANGSLIEKLAAYNEANRMVAVLCNHQKSVSKNHGASMDKMENQIRAIKYQRRKLRYGLFTMEKKYKKDPELADDESDLEDEWIATYEDESREKEMEKAKKKFEKDNEKRQADDESPLGADVLEERIEKVHDEYNRLKEERGSTDVQLKGKKSAEQIVAAIEKLDARIKTEKFKMDDREKGKEVSLGTSKINYLDPRITTAWCKKHDVPIEKMFSKTLMVKFPWAMTVDETWVF